MKALLGFLRKKSLLSACKNSWHGPTSVQDFKEPRYYELYNMVRAYTGAIPGERQKQGRTAGPLIWGYEQRIWHDEQTHNIIWFKSVFRGIRKRTFVKVHEKLQFMNWCLTCSFLSWHSVQAIYCSDCFLVNYQPLEMCSEICLHLKTCFRDTPLMLTRESVAHKSRLHQDLYRVPQTPGPWSKQTSCIICSDIQLIDLNWIESRALWGWYGFLNRISPILRNRTIDSWDVLNWLSTLCSDRQTLMITRSGYGEVYGSGWEAMYWCWKIYAWLYTKNDIRKSMTSLCMLVTI